MLTTLATIAYPRFDPIALRLGPVAIRWYGLAYLVGFALGYAMLRRLGRRGELRASPSAIGDLVGWLALGVMVGGRSGWWLFYHRDVGQVERWYEPLAIWHGGMSFHGGLIGAVAVLALWCRRTRTPFWNVADCLALVAPAGLFLGRVANFVNAELVGRVTSVPWGVIFPGDTLPRHPSQLYEALLEGPLLLIVLWSFRKRLWPRAGSVATLFLVAYGAVRFAVEFTREPDPQLGFVAWGWLTMGQLLSAGIIAVGAVIWLRTSRAHGSGADHPRVFDTIPRGV